MLFFSVSFHVEKISPKKGIFFFSPNSFSSFSAKLVSFSAFFGFLRVDRTNIIKRVGERKKHIVHRALLASSFKVERDQLYKGHLGSPSGPRLLSLLNV